MIRVRVNRKDVARINRNIDLLPKYIAHFAGIAAKRAGEDYASLVKSGIGLESTPPFVNTQWKPLSEFWKSKKTAHTEEFWIETGAIFKNIRSKFRSKSQIEIEVFAGLEKGDDQDAFIRAMKNEYGPLVGSKAPARPLFGPAVEFFTKITGGFRKIKKDSMVWARFLSVTKNALKKVYGS